MNCDCQSHPVFHCHVCERAKMAELTNDCVTIDEKAVDLMRESTF